MPTQRAVIRRHNVDVHEIEAVLIDNNAGNFVSPNLAPSFDLEIPDLVVADISVSYLLGGSRAADVYEIKALRRALSKDAVTELHSVTGGERSQPESWRVIGPMFVRVNATATGSGPTITGQNHLIAGVVLSPAQPMCRDEWEERAKRTTLTPRKTFSSQD